MCVVCVCVCVFMYAVLHHFTFHFVIARSSLILAQIDLIHVGDNREMTIRFSLKTLYFVVLNIYESLRFI